MTAVPFIFLHRGHRGVVGGSPRQPDTHQPPLPIQAASARLLGDFAALLLLAPVEAGAEKADELDAELLDCCDAATEADRASDRAMRLLLHLIDTGMEIEPLAASLARDVAGRGG